MITTWLTATARPTSGPSLLTTMIPDHLYGCVLIYVIPEINESADPYIHKDLITYICTYIICKLPGGQLREKLNR